MKVNPLLSEELWFLLKKSPESDPLLIPDLKGNLQKSKEGD